jgi:3-(3-hydroxy-phenyl)propionate hydroxylase
VIRVDCDLVIVGCGPVGAMAANLAGQAGLSAVVIEEARQIYDLPRAIHFDAQIMRILQQAGLAEAVLPHTRVSERSTFYGADSKIIRVHNWPRGTPYGWQAHYMFYQPELERVLRAGLGRYEQVDVRLGVRVTGLAQHPSSVSVTTEDTVTGERGEITARYLIGADGASSLVRSAGAVRLLDRNFDEPWLVVDVRTDIELAGPNESEMFCDPARPSTRVPGPGNHHRWEFMLLPGESPVDMQQPEAVLTLLKPWLRADDVEIIRASVYRFHALVADRWRAGRVFLVGDAAHQTPPFLGQGLCHGIRDVQNLIFKIGAALAGGPEDTLLDSYQAERRPHVEQIIDIAVTVGRDICLLDPVAAAERDQRMRNAAASGMEIQTTFQAVPPLHGGLFTATVGAGELFPQPEVRATDRASGDIAARPPALFDDVVGDEPTIVAVPRAARELRDLAAELAMPLVTTEAASAGPGHLVAVSGNLDGWLADRRATVAIVRPDRYVQGTTDDLGEAEAMARDLRALLPARRLAR